eukprot:scaffold95213_cov61-Phaeocystis_antarctica.AAC.2
MPEASVSGVEVEVDTDKRIAALADVKRALLRGAGCHAQKGGSQIRGQGRGERLARRRGESGGARDRDQDPEAAQQPTHCAAQGGGDCEGEHLHCHGAAVGRRGAQLRFEPAPPLPTDAPASRPVVAQLFNRIVEKGCYPEAEAADLFAQILLSIDYLHSLNIVHRDVKPENILFISTDSSDMKLIDFGYAGLWQPDRELTGLCGTPDYVAPEVLTWYDDDDNGTPYGKGSDLWSLGVLLY